MYSSVELYFGLFRFPAIYLLYAKLEEEYGLARHAMAVYERSTQAVEAEERHLMFNIYIKRAAEIYGVTHTRAIYQKAIEVRCALCASGNAEQHLDSLTNLSWDLDTVLCWVGGIKKYSSCITIAATFTFINVRTMRSWGLHPYFQLL